MAQAPATEPDVVVRGAAPHCQARPGDPLDEISARAPTQNWYFVVRSSAGGYEYERGVSNGADGPPPEGDVTTLDEWRRAGDALPSFVFRQPRDGSPLCIGRRPNMPGGAVQLQQQLRAEPYWCKSVRLTMYVASRKAKAIVWLNGGGAPVMVPFTGNRSWTPLKIDWSMIDFRRRWLQFGVIQRDGDVWFYKPEVTTIPDDELANRARTQQASCRAAQASWEKQKLEYPGVVAREAELDAATHGVRKQPVRIRAEDMATTGITASRHAGK